MTAALTTSTGGNIGLMSRAEADGLADTFAKKLLGEFPDIVGTVEAVDEAYGNGKAVISWTDGPSLARVSAAVEGLGVFKLRRSTSLLAMTALALSRWAEGNHVRASDQTIVSFTLKDADPQLVLLAEAVMQVWDLPPAAPTNRPTLADRRGRVNRYFKVMGSVQKYAPVVMAAVGVRPEDLVPVAGRSARSTD
jgi:hypothetical protein